MQAYGTAQLKDSAKQHGSGLRRFADTIRMAKGACGELALEHFAFEIIQFQSGESGAAIISRPERGLDAHCFSRCDEGSYG
ncbi:hypothetical protein [Desulfovibrio sp. ZJ369]|uniref:hypothetical protein n=1 Tax=Desulfovibrio sp. ZJ369 TaxID=2709793 RepID=UPI0013EB40E3|nr:hypothetical protein [Desulfovibrio sp. ZJ369]